MTRTKQLVMAGVIMIATGCERADVLDEVREHLDSTTTIAPTSGFGDPTTVATVDSSGNENWVGGSWYIPLPVSAGDVIGTVQAIVRDNGSANGHLLDGNNVLAVLQSRIAGSTSALASASSDGSGTQQTLSITATHTVASGEQLVVEYIGLTGGAIPGPSTVPSMTGPVTASPRAPKQTIASCTVLALLGPSLGSAWTSGIGPNGEAFALSTTAATIPVTLPLAAGDRIKEFSFKVSGNGSADLAATVYHVDSSMVGTQIGMATVTDPAASWSTVTIDVADTVISQLDAVNIHLVASAAGVRLGNVSYTYDHPTP